MYAANTVQRNQSYPACHDQFPDLHFHPPPSFPLFSLRPSFSSPPAALPRIVLWPSMFPETWDPETCS